MVALISPWSAVTRYPKTAAGWAAARTALLAYLYPAGLPTKGADSIVRDLNLMRCHQTYPEYVTSALPTGCAKIDEYCCATPGGRSGGTPLYGQLCYPSATPVGKLLIWAGGHIGVTPWWSYAAYGAASSLAGLALAAGWHVLGVDMPGVGAQPAAEVITVNGTPTAFTDTHAFAALDADGGPLGWRMFTEHIITFLTQAIADLAPTQVVMAGHSGGVDVTGSVGALDSRLNQIAVLQGPKPICAAPGYNGPTHWEMYVQSIFYSTVALGDIGSLLALAASWPGRYSFLADQVGAEDITDEQYRREKEYWCRFRETLGIADKVTLWRQDTDEHNPNAAESAACFNFFQGN